MKLYEIPGYNGEYMITKDGRVWANSVPYKNDKNKRTTKARWLPQYTDKYGYPIVNIRNKLKTVHRLMASTFIPNPDNKPFVNHISGNKADCSISNLEWCTAKENTIHAFATNLAQATKGEERAYSKLSDQIVKTIREDNTSTQKNLSIAYGVDQSLISRIKKGQRWAHVN